MYFDDICAAPYLFTYKWVFKIKHKYAALNIVSKLLKPKISLFVLHILYFIFYILKRVPKCKNIYTFVRKHLKVYKIMHIII